MVWCLSLTWKNTLSLLFEIFHQSIFLLPGISSVCRLHVCNWSKVLRRSIFPFFFSSFLSYFMGDFWWFAFKLTDSFSSHFQAADEPTKEPLYFRYGILSLQPFLLILAVFISLPTVLIYSCKLSIFFPITGLNILIKVVFNFVSDNSKICLIPETGLEGWLFFSDCVSLAF